MSYEFAVLAIVIRQPPVTANAIVCVLAAMASYVILLYVSQYFWYKSIYPPHTIVWPNLSFGLVILYVPLMVYLLHLVDIAKMPEAVLFMMECLNACLVQLFSVVFMYRAVNKTWTDRRALHLYLMGQVWQYLICMVCMGLYTLILWNMKIVK